MAEQIAAFRFIGYKIVESSIVFTTDYYSIFYR